MFELFWKRRESVPERRLTDIRREMKLLGEDIDALSETVRSGGQVPPPKGLQSEEWRRKRAEEEEAELLPDWFPRGSENTAPVQNEHGFVRNEKFVDYLASNFQPVQAERTEQPDEETGDKRWILIGLVVVIVLLYCLAKHWM